VDCGRGSSPSSSSWSRIDLFLVGGGKQHRVSVKEAATWSGIWVVVSLPLRRRPLVVPRRRGRGARVANTKALEFVTGYLIEKCWPSTTSSSG